MSGHTPAPWRTHTDDFGLAHGSVTYVPVEDGKKTIAYVIASHPVGGYYPYRENAHLIAAAPELLEALKQIAADTHGTVDDPDASRINRIARAALAKAEGRV